MHRLSRFRREGSAERVATLLFATLFILLALTARAEDPNGEASARRTHEVGPVQVTATRAERGVLEVPGNVTVIDREAIDRSGAEDIPDLLRRQSGIHVRNTISSPAGNTLEARGFDNGGQLGSSLLVLVDGRRVNESDTGSADWTLLNLDAVERIEIVRGPASALYGDNAVGGVVQIVTVPGAGPMRATLRGRGGTFDTGGGSFSAAGSVGPLAASVIAHGIRTNSYRDQAHFHGVDVNGTIELSLGERAILGFNGGYHDDERDFPGSLSRDEMATLGRRAADPDFLGSGSKVQSSSVRSWLEATLAEDIQLRVQPYYRSREDRTILAGFSLDTDKDSLGIATELRIDRSLGSFPNRLTAGGDFLRETTDRDSLYGSPRYRRYGVGIFVQDELNLTPELLLSAGVRFDRARYRLTSREDDVDETTHPDFNVWSPKAALTYRIAAPISVYASYARGFRLPNFDEDGPILSGFCGPLTIPDLDVQESDAYEVGVKLFSERVQATVSTYQMNVRNEITWDPTVGVCGSNKNFDRVRHRGVEVSVDARVLDWIHLYGSYTLEDVQIRRDSEPAFEGNRMPITPLHRGTAGVLVQLPLWLEAGVNANFVGSRYLANDFANDFQKLGKYSTYDLLLRLRPPLTEHLEGALTFAVRNVFARRYSGFGGLDFINVPGFDPAPRRTYEVRFMLTARR